MSKEGSAMREYDFRHRSPDLGGVSVLAGRLSLYCGLLLVAVLTQEAKALPLDGTWQHPDDPVWIEVSTLDGVGIAIRNDDQPDTVGFHVLKELAASDKSKVWQGQVFVPQLDSYKAVSITLPDDQTLRMTVKFGFIRRSVAWSRIQPTE